MVITLAAIFFPAVVAIVRGLHDNHMGGIIFINVLNAIGTVASTFLGLASLAVLPLSGLVFVALLAWAFIAPGRVADRLAKQRHQELLAALNS